MTDTSERTEQTSEKKGDTPTKDSKTNASPKSSPTKKDIDIATQAVNHFAQGKRHLLVNDITSAVNSLQEACRLLAEHYGETAPECGDAYFYYGKALLELARIENGVLGNALDGEEGSTEEDDKDDDEDSKDDDKDDEDEDGSQDEEMANQENGDVAEEPEGEKTEDSEEEEVGNLQLAWEMLELAKVIYTKQLETNPSMNLKIAQVYLKLGEVGLENENYTQSVEDFQQCLNIQTKELATDDRCLAETHYQMGVAFSFSDDFDKAVESFGGAAKVIEERMSNLEKIKEEKSSWSEEQKMKDAAERKDPFYTEQGEIDELANLLPEVKEKIVDMEQMKKDSKEKLQKIKEATFASVLGGTRTADGASTSGVSSSFSEGFSSSTDSNKPTSNISHLIRKKRKPEEEATKEETKKAKGENGEAKPSPALNGGSVENGTQSEKKPEAVTAKPVKVASEQGDKSTEATA